MLTRMQDIKGGKLDEDKLGINNVEIALRRANIQLRDSNDSFRDFGAVLEELAGKWKDLTEVEQAYISKAIAGVRQVNIFTALMANMDRALELQKVQFEATGLATERYAIYMESLEAKIGTFKATLQGLYQDAITSGFIGRIIDFGTELLNLIDKTGGLEAALKKAAIAFGVFKAGMFGLKNAKNIADTFSVIKTALDYISVSEKGKTILYALTGISSGLTSIEKESRLVDGLLKVLAPDLVATAGAAKLAEVGALSASAGFSTLAKSIWAASGPIGPLVAALGAFIAIGAIVEETTVTQAEAWNNLVRAQEELIDINKQLEPAEELNAQYKKLLVEISRLEKGTKEYTDKSRELLDVKNQLVDLFPNIVTAYDSEGNAISDVTEQVERQIRALRELAQEKRAQEREAAEEFLFGTLGRTVEDKSARGGYRYETYYGSDTSSLELAYANRGKDPQAFLDTLEQYKTLMLTIGVEGSQNFVDGLRDGLPDVLSESLNQFLEDMKQATRDEGEQWLSDYWAKRTEFERRQRVPEGVSGAKLENAVGFGYDKELNDYLYGTKIPEALEQMKLFQEALENIRNSEPISEDTISKIEALGVEFDRTTQTFTYGEGAEKRVIATSKELADVQFEVLNKNFELTDSNIELWNSFIQAAVEAGKLEEAQRLQRDTEEELGKAHEELMSRTSELVSAMEEQGRNGKISAETALEIAKTNSVLFESLEEVEGGYRMAEDAIYAEIAVLNDSFNALVADAEAGKYGAEVKTVMSQAAAAAAEGNYALAISAIESGEAAFKQAGIFQYLIEILERLGQIKITMPTFQGVGGFGGAGGSGGEDPRIKKYEDEIDEIEDLIDLEEDRIDIIKDEIDLEKDRIAALKKLQDEYKDWISDKKKSLQLAKEESDYYKEQKKDLKALADIRKQIALLGFDTSEEATAKRQKLEAEAIKIEEDIAEKAEERRHEMQMQALDNLQKSFETMIEKQIEGIQSIIDAKEEQIKVIQDGIEIHRKRIEEIRDLIKEIRSQRRSGGGSGGGYGSSSYIANPGGGGSEGTVGGTIVTVNGSPVLLPEGSVIQKPFNPTGTHHNQNSIDFGTPFGTIIGSPVTGQLLGSGMSSAYGGWAAVGTPENPFMVYHLDQESIDALTGLEGQIFKMGQQIGVSGNTGGINGIPHVGIMAGEYWNQAEYDANKANRMINDIVEWAFKQPSKTDELAQEYGEIAEYIRNGILVNAIELGLSDVTKQIDVSSMDNKDAIVADLQDGFITLEDAVSSGLIENGESLKALRIVTEQGTETLVYTYQNGIYGFARIVTAAINSQKTQTWKPPLANAPKVPGSQVAGNRAVPMLVHSGGLIESHHEGDFAGNLRSNEVFAKLLKGEYVATEAQMDNFLKNILPNIANIPRGKYTQPPNINVNMPITVEGNLDKTVLPDIKKVANQVIDEINKSIVSRGYIRPANNTLS